MTRSYLFTPADDPRKVAKALASSADAVILDLEDSVTEARRPVARDGAAEALASRRGADGKEIWVRINPLDSEDADLDLEAVVAAAPSGIVLPKPESAADAIDLAARLDELEAAAGAGQGHTRIICICTERPEALFALGGYRDATPRLAALTWGAEDLSALVGAAANRGGDGEWLAPYQLARSLCLFAAAAAGVPAIDTIYTNFRDADGLARHATAARRDGYGGVLAIHPAQIETIHAAFTPTRAEVDRARRIVDLFDNAGGAGTVGLDGVMLDRPHLAQARRTLALAERASAIR
jgi:citrate lyase subunit beta/citryl-CoA lyase